MTDEPKPDTQSKEKSAPPAEQATPEAVEHAAQPPAPAPPPAPAGAVTEQPSRAVENDTRSAFMPPPMPAATVAEPTPAMSPEVATTANFAVRMWRWIGLHSGAIGAVTGIVGLAFTAVAAAVGIWTLVIVRHSERRAGIESAQRRQAEERSLTQGERTYQEMRRNAEAAVAADSARRAEAEARGAEQRAAAAAAEATKHRQAREVAELDGEVALRLSLLVDSLNAVGLEPTPTRRPNEGAYYNRITRAFQRFLSPRDRMRQGYAIGLTTHALLENIVQRDSDPEVLRARVYLRGMTTGRNYEDFSGAGWAPSGADTPSVFFYEPGSPSYTRKPIREVLGAFRLKRWSR